MQQVTPVWLVGMMGAGKSSVGRALALRWNWPFLDTDEEIEREAGRSVAEIFAAEGEAGFRERERAVVARCAQERAVVALGGGAMAQRACAAILTGTGTIVYLRARPETLLDRVGLAEGRPLLAGLDPSDRLERVRALTAERDSAYAIAELTIDTDEQGLDDVVDAIVEELGGAG